MLSVDSIRQLPDLSKKFMSKSTSVDKLKLLSSHVIDNTTFPSEPNRFLVRTRKLNDWRALAILSWYIESPEVGWVLRMSLREMSIRLDDIDRELFTEFFLVSKGRMELFLMETSLWYDNDFWGTFYNQKNLQRVFSLVDPFVGSQKVKKPQRKRGYDDKGNRRESHLWIETHDYSFYEEQENIERRRRTAEDTASFTVGFYT